MVEYSLIPIPIRLLGQKRKYSQFEHKTLRKATNDVTSKSPPTLVNLRNATAPLREASIFRPKMPDIMPLLNLKKIIPFHSGGGGGAA